MSILNPANIHLAVPDYGIDKVIGVFSNTLSLAAPTLSSGFTSVIDPHIHGYGDSTYFQGIYTMDAGVTWNDFGSQTPNLTAPNPEFQTLDVEAMVDGINVNVNAVNYYDIAHSSSTARTLTYKLYTIAKNTMAVPLSPLPTNYQLPYDTANNYQKVYFQSSTPISIAAGSSGSTGAIAHELNYIPKIRAFFVPASNSAQVLALNQVVWPATTTAPQIEAHLTSTSLVFTSDQTASGSPGVTGTIEFRIYLDS